MLSTSLLINVLLLFSKIMKIVWIVDFSLVLIKRMIWFSRVSYISQLVSALPHLLSQVHRHLVFGRNLCCATVKSLFINEGKHGGEATVEAVHMIAELVKTHDCQLHPDSVQVRNLCLWSGFMILCHIIFGLGFAFCTLQVQIKRTSKSWSNQL